MDRKSNLEELQPATSGLGLLLHCSHSADHRLLPLCFGFYEPLALCFLSYPFPLCTQLQPLQIHVHSCYHKTDLSRCSAVRDRTPIPKILNVSKRLAKGIKLLRVEDRKREVVLASFCTCRLYIQELFVVTSHCQQWT